MSSRPRPAFALALATAIAGVAAPVPAAADEPEELVERCYTQALTAEEVADGATSVVECIEVSPDTPVERRGSFNAAKLFDSTDGTGTFVYVEATGCTNAKVNFSSTHPWNDRIGSTELLACGYAKHWTGFTYTGTNQSFTGLGLHAMGSMNNLTSSIEYAP